MNFKGAICVNYVISGRPNYWLSEDERDQTEARLLCAGCPVRDNCETRMEELKPNYGIWAGKTTQKSEKQDECIAAGVG